jgi:thymidine phosphorylase
MSHPANTLRARRMRIDTHDQPVVYMRADCRVCRSEGFGAHSRVRIRTAAGRHVVATLEVILDGIIGHGDAGLSEAAWLRLGVDEGERLQLSHQEPAASLQHVRAKIYGHRFDDASLRAVTGDIAQGLYTDVDIAAFVSACGGDRMDTDEIVGLTRAMIEVGERLRWDRTPVVDKHCVGGLPGNRTTLVVVPIVAAAGLWMPKTSSRAITSPAGTADAMEVLAPVTLSLEAMRRVVEQEGGCIVWGGSVHLSPADDAVLRIERALDVDSEGQLVASVLSKKVAAGASHVIVDVPVGPTAKVRTAERGRELAARIESVAERVGLHARAMLTDGAQPVGDGIGPALEARDAVRVLQRVPGAPLDLRDRALTLAGRILELGGTAERGAGFDVARAVLDDGRAWKKLEAIAEAQGGLRPVPPPGAERHVVLAPCEGVVAAIDNRVLARIAKLAGAPEAQRAGVDLHAHLGRSVDAGAPLFTVHAETPGELAYAIDYMRGQSPSVVVAAST